MDFFVTGHTGFKGSWLTVLLRTLGHRVSGYSLEPVRGGLFERAELRSELIHHFNGDVRDKPRLQEALRISKPDVAIHLAAQPLVLKSYEDPIETYTTNVDGTRNFLEAVTSLKKPPITLVVTTDKVYRDSGATGHRENDPLGGFDPYSTSKAMADILSQGWALSNANLKILIARAGNVIGAYDVSEHRLIPDVVRSLNSNAPLKVRNPDSIRPWQHVLDCLNGYLMYIDAYIRNTPVPMVLNFGPDPENSKTVRDVLRVIEAEFPNFKLEIEGDNTKMRETAQLSLDSTLAMKLLNWKNLIPFQDAVRLSLEEIHAVSPRVMVQGQVDDFLRRASLRGPTQ